MELQLESVQAPKAEHPNSHTLPTSMCLLITLVMVCTNPVSIAFAELVSS